MEPQESLQRCELVENLKEEILVWLPLDCLCKCRLVCTQWNALISSTKFITTKWAAVPPHGMPWLVVQDGEPRMPNCFTYCFFTGAWKKTSPVSLSFLLKEEEKVDIVHSGGSTAGLFLVDVLSQSSFPNCVRFPHVFIVCNPLTRAVKRLPHMSSIFIPSAMGIVCDTQETYKVVMMGTSCPLAPLIVEIYDSTEKSWRIVGQVPWDVLVLNKKMIFCDSSFYCLIDISRRWGVMGFSITDGNFVYAPLPEMGDKMTVHLLACGSRVLVAGVLVEVEDVRPVKQVLIWEFKKEEVISSSSSSSWKEIARMPLSMCKDLRRTYRGIGGPFFRCIGVGDCAVIVYHAVDRNEGNVLEMLVYSFSQNSWSFLPSCSIGKGTAFAVRTRYVNVMAFEPRPDMKVE